MLCVKVLEVFRECMEKAKIRQSLESGKQRLEEAEEEQQRAGENLNA